jgi:methylase of polypeptide subunit release factors
MTFGDLEIAYDDRVLTPRPWTTLQSRWAAELISEGLAGPVLELCCGAGQIGLLAIHRIPRQLVCVDSSPVACVYAYLNAAGTGLADWVEVRESDLETACQPDERFGLVIADPPWVPRDGIGAFPEDPPTAIDGGPDGLDVARTCLRVAAQHLLPGGSVLLQLGNRDQVATLAAELAEAGVGEVAGLWLADVREGSGGIVARLELAADRSRSDEDGLLAAT